MNAQQRNKIYLVLDLVISLILILFILSLLVVNYYEIKKWFRTRNFEKKLKLLLRTLFQLEGDVNWEELNTSPSFHHTPKMLMSRNSPKRAKGKHHLESTGPNNISQTELAKMTVHKLKHNLGISWSQIADLGATPSQLVEAGASKEQLIRLGATESQLDHCMFKDDVSDHNE